MNRRKHAHNNGNHDARLLYTIVLASCRALRRLKERGTNVIAADVMRNPHTLVALHLSNGIFYDA